MKTGFEKYQKKPIKINFLLLTEILFILSFFAVYFIYHHIHENKNYDTEILFDTSNGLKVAEYPRIQDYTHFGKIIHNTKNIPNYSTFMIAISKTNEKILMELFSTQFETKVKETETTDKILADEKNTNNEIISETEKKCEKSDIINPEEYMSFILKKLNPNAENIRIIENKTYDDSNIKYQNQEKFLKSLYAGINPPTQKSTSSLENLTIKPVSILFSYYDNGFHYYQRFDCDFTTFKQSVNVTMSSKNVKQEIIYVKCADVFTYKAPKNYYKKYFKDYKIFKDLTVQNHEWLEKNNEKRRDLISKSGYSTTETINAGDKFLPLMFKNQIYMIEYMSENDKLLLKSKLGIMP